MRDPAGGWMRDVSRSNDYFPFHPRFIRWGTLVCAMAAVLCAAWALAGGLGLSAGIRTGCDLLLGAGFLYAFTRLTPRPGWGVELGSSAVRISRPLVGEAASIPWEAIAYARRLGPRKGRLMLVLDPAPGKVILPRRLFLPGDFEALCEAVCARKPPPRADA